MKKLNQIVFVALVAATVLALAACQTSTSSDPEPEPTPVVTYTVTFDANGGAAVASITADEGSTVTLPATTRTGYTFSGWDTNADNVADASSFTITANVTAKALWTINQYTVTFNTEWYGGLSSVASIVANYGSTITLPSAVDDPAISGVITPSGWNSDRDAANAAHIEYRAGDSFTIPDHDVTLYVVVE